MLIDDEYEQALVGKKEKPLHPGESVWVQTNPAYYRSESGLEVMDVIEAFELDHHTASAVSYLIRAGRKDKENEILDLRKATWYIQRRIGNIEKANREGTPE